MNDHAPILCFGEIVWDAMPEGIFLGGAPLNVAYHLTRLGFPALPVSRIGRDFLGDQTLRRLKDFHVTTDLIQEDETHPTGAVVISLDEKGDADYRILEPVAWDFIEPDDSLMQVASTARAIVYGTLATRSPGNAEVLGRLLDRIPFSVCDVNLRKPHDDPKKALEWASRANVVKLNEDELGRLTPDIAEGSLAVRVAALSNRLPARTIVVTCGGEGAYVWHEGVGISRKGPPVEVADTVGAGDAFTAAFLGGYLRTESVDRSLDMALHFGSYVAGQRGAQPDYDPKEFSL